MMLPAAGRYTWGAGWTCFLHLAAEKCQCFQGLLMCSYSTWGWGQLELGVMERE